MNNWIKQCISCEHYERNHNRKCMPVIRHYCKLEEVDCNDVLTILPTDVCKKHTKRKPIPPKCRKCYYRTKAAGIIICALGHNFHHLCPSYRPGKCISCVNEHLDCVDECEDHEDCNDFKTEEPDEKETIANLKAEIERLKLKNKGLAYAFDVITNMLDMTRDRHTLSKMCIEIKRILEEDKNVYEKIGVVESLSLSILNIDDK